MSQVHDRTYLAVPDRGPLAIGTVYKRSDLHGRFGGSRIAGIVPLKHERIVLLFHTEELTQQFYQDGFSEDGLYWYSGEGTFGDMRWSAANRAVRDHKKRGNSLLFFERAQRKGGLWKFSYVMQLVRYEIEKRVDKRGQKRSVIIFGLIPIACAS